MKPTEAILERLCELMVIKKVNKYQLEKRSGLTHSAIRYLFNGTIKDLKFSTILKFCDALEITVQEFFNSQIFDLEKIQYDF